MSIPKGEAAKLMRALGDDERDELIAAAGRKVIDMRGHFSDCQKQQDLARAYRRPRTPGGVA